MSLRRMTVISKDVNGESTRLSPVVLAECTVEIDLCACRCEVML